MLVESNPLGSRGACGTSTARRRSQAIVLGSVTTGPSERGKSDGSGCGNKLVKSSGCSSSSSINKKSRSKGISAHKLASTMGYDGPRCSWLDGVIPTLKSARLAVAHSPISNPGAGLAGVIGLLIRLEVLPPDISPGKVHEQYSKRP